MKFRYLIILFMVVTETLFGQGKSEGKTGLSFLKIGVDARAVGMAGAYTAVASDAAAVYWNPAGLLNTKHSNVLFNHNEWIEGIRGEFAAVMLAGKKSAWALHVRSLNLGNIEVRTIPDPEPLENTSAHFLSAGISYARLLSEDIRIGLTAKYLFEKIYVESASGYALDFGIVYQSLFPQLRFAAAVQNIGKMNSLREEDTTLPIITRFGMFYDAPLPYRNFEAGFAVDFVKPIEESVRLHLGTDLVFWKTIALRAGLMEGYEARNFSFGAGVLRTSIRLDYAITPFGDDLGVGHRFSVNFNL